MRLSPKRIAPLLLALASLSAGPVAGQRFRTGDVAPTAERLSRIPMASGRLAKSSLPVRMDLSPNFPAPGSQGSQGSCVGWAVSYLKSYHEMVEERFWTRPAIRIFSPAFIYNQINGGVDEGSSIPDALDLITSQGIAPLDAMPYNSQDHLAQPSDTARSAARPFRIERWQRAAVRDLAEVKAQLAAGYPLVVSMTVDQSFHKLQRNQVWMQSDGVDPGRHAMVLVGYDDERMAVKLLNSWGRDWGNDGFGWVGYDQFLRTVNQGYVAKDASNGGPLPPPPPPSVVAEPTPVPTPPATVASDASDAQRGLFASGITEAALGYLRQKAGAGTPVVATALTPDGGHAFVYGRNGFGRTRIPPALEEQLLKLNKEGRRIRRVAIAPAGNAWVVLSDDKNGWSAAGVPESGFATLREWHARGDTISDAGFLSDGTLILIAGMNRFWASGPLPSGLQGALESARAKGERVSHMAFGPTLSWAIIRNGNGHQTDRIPPEMAAAIKTIWGRRTPIRAMSLSASGGWVVLEERAPAAAKSAAPPRIPSALSFSRGDGSDRRVWRQQLDGTWTETTEAGVVTVYRPLGEQEVDAARGIAVRRVPDGEVDLFIPYLGDSPYLYHRSPDAPWSQLAEFTLLASAKSHGRSECAPQPAETAETGSVGERLPVPGCSP